MKQNCVADKQSLASVVADDLKKNKSVCEFADERELR